MDLSKKRVLVTGASGFIGSHLVEGLLVKGAEVRCLVHYNGRNNWGNLEQLPKVKKQMLDVRLGDIQDSFFVRNIVKDCDVVFHLAALIAIPYSYIAPQSYIATNVAGTLNIMQASLESKVTKVVHTSTSEVYGTAIYVPIDEKHPLQGQSPYSASKIAADKIAESFNKSYDLPVATLRPFNTYGPRQSARAIIPAIMAQAILYGAVELGALDPVRDFTFVKDTVKAFIMMAENDQSVGEEIQVGTGEGVDIKTLVEIIFQLIGKEIKIKQNPERQRPTKSEVMKLICDFSKAKKILKWEPSYTLTEGLNEVKNYIQQNIDLYKPDLYNV